MMWCSEPTNAVLAWIEPKGPPLLHSCCGFVVIPVLAALEACDNGEGPSILLDEQLREYPRSESGPAFGNNVSECWFLCLGAGTRSF